jgi:hypothetical protein
MLEGRYHDVVRDADDRVVSNRGWHSNAITYGAWTVVTALLRNDPNLRGLLFCAVGSGDVAWDRAPPSSGASAGRTRLRAEVDRRALAESDFVYLDPRGNAARGPTDRLEVTARFAWPQGSKVLREFGLFGGDATATVNTGYLMNYVMHPVISLAAGQTLTRRVRFTLRPTVGGGASRSDDWLQMPRHWLASESLELLDGVGETYATSLREAGIRTIGALAESDPASLWKALPVAKLVETRAKARLVLRVAAAIPAYAGLAERTAWSIIATPVAELATAAAVAPVALETLQEQLAVLQLALDARYLKKVTTGELAAARRS